MPIIAFMNDTGSSSWLKRQCQLIISLLLLLSLLAVFVIIDRPQKDIIPRGLPNGLIIGLLYLSLFLSLMFAYFSSNVLLRLASLLLIWLTVAFHCGFWAATGSSFTLDEALMMRQSLDAAPSAIAMYWPSFCITAILTLVLVVIVQWLAVKYVIAFRPRWSLVLLPTLVCMAVIFWYSVGRINAYPTPFRICGIVIYQFTHYYDGPRDQPYFEPENAPAIPHVVLVVDESITATHLGINGYRRDTTPFLQSLGSRLWSGGIASSGGNSSYTSHAVLFCGVRENELPDQNFNYLRKPTLAQYAAAAGIKFGFFDAQDYRRLLAHSLNNNRAVYYSVSQQRSVARHQRDFALVEQLASHIASNEYTFSYVAKFGSHYPYEMTYPQERQFFTPTLAGYTWSSDIRANCNSYDNAVSWSCDEFLRRLFAAIEKLDRDVLVVYTSDHGQVLPGLVPGNRQTHFNPDLPPNCAAVPLMAWGTGSGQHIVNALAANKSLLNKSSHFDVFQTMLKLMGYGDSAATSYGPTLFDTLPENRQRYYLGGMIENSTRARLIEFRLDQMIEEDYNRNGAEAIIP